MCQGDYDYIRQFRIRPEMSDGEEKALDSHEL